ADPDAAAVGRATRLMFEKHHLWADLVERISNDGVTLPTVGVVASAVKLGSVHSGVVWDVTAEQFGFSRIIDDPLMQGGRSQVAIAACRGAANPDAAKAFVDFVCDDVKSRQTLEQNGFALD
ncbi:MAG: substrate-binding domain-containing protein, partial [Planctomycetota bacterium]